MSFDDEAAEVYADIRAKLEKAGTRIGAYDLQIAAIARSRGLVLVTHNVSEFSRVDGLVIDVPRFGGASRAPPSANTSERRTTESAPSSCR